MACLSVHLLIAKDSDGPLKSEPLTPEYMQYVSMEALFSRISNDHLVEFSRGRPIREICEWNMREFFNMRFNVQCSDNQIQQIYFEGNFDYGNFGIAFAPPCVRSLVIIGAHQFYSVDTGHFPREARNINLSKNTIFGEIDLKRLPYRLQFLSLNENNISGEIDVTQLPRSMRYINLRHNVIKQKVLLINEFPPHFHSIELYRNEIDVVMPMGQTSQSGKKKVNLQSAMKHKFGAFIYGKMTMSDDVDA